MTSIDDTTPQLNLVKRLFDAYCTRDINNVLLLLAKDYTFKTFPTIPDMPDETKASHLERYGPLLSLFTKIEVCTQHWVTPPGPANTHYIRPSFTR